MYVLIILIVTGVPGGYTNQITMQEWSSKARCENALFNIVANAESHVKTTIVKGYCTEK